MDLQAPFLGSRARFTPPGESPDHPMPDPARQPLFCRQLDDFRGIWHGQPRFFPEYGPKYGGGLGTYPSQTRPMAVHAPDVHKTFFCWGGTTTDSDPRQRCWDFGPGGLLQMVAFFDHRTHRFSPPVCVFDKWCADPHDNPALQIAPDGHLWLFSPSHGGWTTRSFIHRSTHPFDIRHWETISDHPLFAYPQPWVDPAFGWMFLHTEYASGRGLRIKFSPDGRTWSPSTSLAESGEGHYQVSCFDPDLRILATAFDRHPPGGGLDARTDLHFLQSTDGGHSWTNAAGLPIPLPVLQADAPSRIRDYASEGKLVYLRDLKFTADARPVILYVTSSGYEPGPLNAPHQWMTAVWSGTAWDFRPVLVSDNNYDHGELDIRDGLWTLIAPTAQGPQPWNPGGEIEVWRSSNEGRSWTLLRRVTHNSPFNHTFCRMPYRSHPDFAAFWADGHAREPSPSHLHACSLTGAHHRLITPG